MTQIVRHELTQSSRDDLSGRPESRRTEVAKARPVGKRWVGAVDDSDRWRTKRMKHGPSVWMDAIQEPCSERRA